MPRFDDRGVLHDTHEISPELRDALKVVYVARISRDASPELIRTMLLPIHQVAPVDEAASILRLR